MSTLEIIELVGLSIIALVLVIYFLVKAIKNRWIEQLASTLSEALYKAEQSGMAGPEKKQFVMEAIEKKCLELGIPYHLAYKLISRLIETIIKCKNAVDKGGSIL